MRRPLTIAIDGPAASGKGTLARRLALRLGLDHLDTGTLYRAVALAVLRSGGDPSDPAAAAAAARALDPASSPERLTDPALRSDEVGAAASKVSSVPSVRAALLDFQRSFAANPPGGRGAILDGRDIGTVVLPDATVKLFVTADQDIRAQRRLEELRRRGEVAMFSAVLADMQERDARDSQRVVAPLAVAAGAFVLDTSSLDADQAVAVALDRIESVLAGCRHPDRG